MKTVATRRRSRRRSQSAAGGSNRRKSQRSSQWSSPRSSQRSSPSPESPSGAPPLTNETLRAAVRAYARVGRRLGREESAILAALPDVIGDWDVSAVTDFNRLFRKWRGPVPDVAAWNVSSAETMRYMFEGADVSRLGDIGSSWRVNNARDLSFMFARSNIQASFACAANLRLWRVTSARTLLGMFLQAQRFNGAGLEEWGPSTAAVEDMRQVFALTQVEHSFRQWDASNVRCTSCMFYGSAAGVPPRRIPASFLPSLRQGTIIADFRQSTPHDEEFYDEQETFGVRNELPAWTLAEMDPYLDINVDPRGAFLTTAWIQRYDGDMAWNEFHPSSPKYSLRAIYTQTAPERMLAFAAGGSRSRRR